MGENITAIMIVGIIFSFLIISTFFENERKKEKQKLEAALRMEEMRRGYAPGTYSYKFDRKSSSAKKYNRQDRHNRSKNDFKPENFKNTNVDDEMDNRNTERANLKKGIDDLMTRLNNLETIMKEDKENET